MIQVVVASQDLPKGSQIGNHNMAIRSLPKKYVYKSSVRPNNFALYQGRYITEALSKGTPLLSTMVKAEFSKDFSDIIGDGRRAIAAPEAAGVGVSFRPADGRDQTPHQRSDTQCQKAGKVVAIGESTLGDTVGVRVGMLVEPEETAVGRRRLDSTGCRE